MLWVNDGAGHAGYQEVQKCGCIVRIGQIAAASAACRIALKLEAAAEGRGLRKRTVARSARLTGA